MQSNQNSNNPNISIIIPVYNEEDSVAELHREIVSSLKRLNCSYEIIFIDDGSTDETFMQLSLLAPVTVIRFRRNFGQTAALDTGIKHAKGIYIITLDGDGQNDPADISKLLRKIEQEDLDVVAGWRKDRKDSFSKRFASKCAAVARRILINDGIHDSGCTLKIFRKECFEHIDLSGEMHRFIPGILKIKGFQVGEIVVNHRPRKNGTTKYNIWRGIRGILDMFSIWFWRKYADRPLHLFGSIGIILILVSIIAGGWAMYEKIIYGFDLSDTALTTLAMFGLLIGIQFFVFGLLADILSKSYFASTRDTIYNIKEIIKKK